MPLIHPAVADELPVEMLAVRQKVRSRPAPPMKFCNVVTAVSVVMARSSH